MKNAIALFLFVVAFSGCKVAEIKDKINLNLFPEKAEPIIVKLGSPSDSINIYIEKIEAKAISADDRGEGTDEIFFIVDYRYNLTSNKATNENKTWNLKAGETAEAGSEMFEVEEGETISLSMMELDSKVEVGLGNDHLGMVKFTLNKNGTVEIDETRDSKWGGAVSGCNNCYSINYMRVDHHDYEVHIRIEQ